MPELDIPQSGTPIASGTFGQPVVYRVVSRYASVAARDNETPSGAGETCYVQDIDEFQVWDGSAWVTYQPSIGSTEQTVDVDAGAPAAFFGRFVYSWTDVGAVTCSYVLTPGTVTPWASETFTGAIPSAVRPDGALYGLTSSYNDPGLSQTGGQTWRGIRFGYPNLDQVFLDAMDQSAYPPYVLNYRGTFTYNIGAAAAT